VLGQVAGFFSSPVPISGIVESWCSGHGTRPFLGAVPQANSGNAMWFLFQARLTPANCIRGAR
jgi:hypothetical protein